MTAILAVFVVVGFAAAIEYLELPRHARDVARRGGETLHVLRDESLTDAEKEEMLQREATQLFGLLGILAGGSVLALGVPLTAVWGLEKIGVGSFHGTLVVLQRIDFLLGTVVVGGLAYFLIQRVRGS